MPAQQSQTFRLSYTTTCSGSWDHTPHSQSLGLSSTRLQSPPVPISETSFPLDPSLQCSLELLTSPVQLSRIALPWPNLWTPCFLFFLTPVLSPQSKTLLSAVPTHVSSLQSIAIFLPCNSACQGKGKEGHFWLITTSFGTGKPGLREESYSQTSKTSLLAC